MTEFRDEKLDAQENLRVMKVALPVGVYRHYKGGFYVVFAHSVDESTLGALVHYYSLERHTRWTRTFADFGGRAGDVAKRFVWIREASPWELREAYG